MKRVQAIRAKAIQTKKKKREFKILFVARSNVLLLVACINILFVLVKCACAAPKIILLLRTRVLSSFSLSRNLTTANVSFFHSFATRKFVFYQSIVFSPDPRFGARWTLIGIDIELVRSFFFLLFFTIVLLLASFSSSSSNVAMTFAAKPTLNVACATDGHTYSLGNVTV